MLFPEQTARLLERCQFPRPGEPIDCAVSGGADSTTLMALAVAHGCRVTAYHVDHGLRAESATEAGIVARTAARVGAAFVARAVVCAPGPNLEARARAMRYAALPAGVATGHTADDQAETVLLNLVRGAGRAGLAGMRPGPRHPILALRRAETEAYARALGVEVVEDTSNADARFRRNRVRSEVIPLLDAIADRDVVGLIARQCDVLRDESDLLDSLAAGIDAADVVALREAPLPLARRAVRSWLRRALPDCYPPDAAAVDRVLGVARGEATACEVAGGARVRRSKGRLSVAARVEGSELPSER